MKAYSATVADKIFEVIGLRPNDIEVEFMEE